jgi:gamma-glutamyltranspeptidase/glutathione hydrolase
LEHAAGLHGAVASIHPLATRAGLDVLKRGGNAIDAAVATSAVMGLVAPQYSGLGGGAFILIHMSKGEGPAIIDCREVAPKKANAHLFKKKDEAETSRSLGAAEVEENANKIGYRAVGVPGDLAGLALALEKYGTKTFKELLEPAIVLAENGFPVSKRLSQIFADNVDESLTKARRFLGTGKIYLKNGYAYTLNQTIVNRDLATTLRTIARDGPDAFYRGRIAEIIHDDMERHGGLITSEDLREYHPINRRPAVGKYRGVDIVTMPPPGGGPTIIEILNVLDEFDLGKHGHNSAETINVISHAMMQAFTDKGKYIADPDFKKIPYGDLLTREYAKKVAGKIEAKRADSDITGSDSQSRRGDTVHFSIVDKDRNIVAMTESIECYFGSGVVVEGTGFLLNDQMHDFDPEPGGINSIEPGKRPLSNMAPTLLLKDGEPFMALGGAGGPRIVSSIIAVITNTLDFGMSVRDAVAAPRFHAQNREISVEPAIPESTRKSLAGMGNKVVTRDVDKSEWWYFGAVQAVMLDRKSGGVFGASDPRRDGEASQY